MARPRPLLVLAAGALALVPACGDDDEPGASTTTTTTSPPATGSSSTTSEPADGTTSLGTPGGTGAPAPGTAITTAVYWTRPFGTARPIDVPAYRDADGGPYPFVLYGSVTNRGDAAVDTARIRVDWSVGGSIVHSSSVRVVDATGAPIGSLSPGQSADVLVVIDDEAVATTLPDSVPTFEVDA